MTTTTTSSSTFKPSKNHDGFKIKYHFMLEFNAYDLICPKISFDRVQYRVAYMNFHVYYFSYSLDVITAFFIATKAMEKSIRAGKP